MWTCLHAERRSAAAAALGVRVVEDETLADEARVVIERRPVEVREALRIHVDARALGAVEHVIAVTRARFPGERIAEPGTAAGLDPDPETAARDALFGRHLSNECCGVLTDLQHGSQRAGNTDQKSPILPPSDALVQEEALNIAVEQGLSR